MTQLSSTVSFLKKHGPCRVRDLEAAGFRRQDLRYLISKGNVERLTRGVYQAAKTPMHRNPSYAELFLRAPKVVLCLLSALEYHGLTTQLPHEVWIAIEGVSRVPKITYPPLNVTRFSGDAFSKGIEKHKIEGVTIQVYSIA